MVSKKILRRQITLFFYFLIVIILCSSGYAQTNKDDPPDSLDYSSEKIDEICKSVSDITIPLQDYPGETTKASLKNCDSDSLYYGLEDELDYFKAKQCALINNHNDILTMIYANGKGVQINIDMALHFACLLDASPFEMSRRIYQLDKLRKSKNVKGDFDICDHATSREMTASCEDLVLRAEMKKQKNIIEFIKNRLTPKELIAFQKLQDVSKLYFTARIDNEVERLAMGGLAFGIMEDRSLNERMMKDLKKTLKCKIFVYAHEQYKKSDNQLNFFYKKIQRTQSREYSSINPEGIKLTQRAWIKYRDSLSSFAYLKCPNISVENWNTLITNERVKELKEISGMLSNL